MLQNYLTFPEYGKPMIEAAPHRRRAQAPEENHVVYCPRRWAHHHQKCGTAICYAGAI
jgi:hypothetical protein